MSWAHPEFGQLLATSGSDGFCTIWEERAEGNTTSNSAAPLMSESTSISGGMRWRDTATLTDARKGLSCVKFAPRHLRLQLATASADGVVRIYEGMLYWLFSAFFEVKFYIFTVFFILYFYF